MQNKLDNWVKLSPENWHKFIAIFRQKTFTPRETILLPGENKHELFFVCEGLLRFYYLDENGIESNKAFICENMFAGPLAAFALELPVVYGINALETTTVFVAPYQDFVNLFEIDPAFDRIGRKLAEWLLMRKELRMRSLLQKKAKDRYLEFVKQHPQFVQRVPQYHIASYLGITEVSLSRLVSTIY
jgi:CRP-like cAMP-binding protein